VECDFFILIKYYYVQYIAYLEHYLIIVVNLFVCLKFGLEKMTLKARSRLWTKKSIVLYAVALHLSFFSCGKTGVLSHTFLEILADFVQSFG
jgi:hypothetical protein